MKAPETNVGGTGPDGWKLAKVETADDMLAFDRLPKSIRAKLRDMPINVGAACIADAVRARGARAALVHLMDVERRVMNGGTFGEVMRP